MPIAYPLSLEQFWLTLPLLDCSPPILGSGVVQSRTRGGEIISASVANRMWRVSVTFKPMQHRAASAVLATLDMLQEPGASLLVSPWPVCSIASDLDGTILSGLSPKLHTVAANNYEIRISGLAPGMVLDAGAFLGFDYGSSPVRRAFHRLRTGGEADGSGLTPLLQVSPHVRPGAVTGSYVQLFRPSFRGVVEAGSVTEGSMQGNRRAGIGFAVLQTLGG